MVMMQSLHLCKPHRIFLIEIDKFSFAVYKISENTYQNHLFLKCFISFKISNNELNYNVKTSLCLLNKHYISL